MRLGQGELEHRRVKKYYARTNKNDAVGQITQLERREAALLKIARQQQDEINIPPIASVEQPAPRPPKKRKRSGIEPRKRTTLTLDFAESESLPYTPPEAHYHVSQSRNYHINIVRWLAENLGDPAIKVLSQFSSSRSCSDLALRISGSSFTTTCCHDCCIPISLLTT